MTASEKREYHHLADAILSGAKPCKVREYALEVAQGERAAGPYVRAACKRHLDDLRARKWVWDPAAARKALTFFPNVLTLTGIAEGQPFELEPWQEFAIGSVFGWTHPETGRRRYKYAYIETAKGSGKTPMAAGIALYMLLADDHPRAEVYISAASLEQSKITMRDIHAMIDYSDFLQSQVKRLGGDRMESIKHLDTGSELKPLPYSSAGTGYSGLRPHCAIIDELHEHRTGAMLDRMTAGFKSDPGALCVMITNSGVDRNSVCYQERAKAIRAVSSDTRHANRFGFVCALDEGDDPFDEKRGEACWPKANPGMREDGTGIPGTAYLRDRVNDAEGSPATLSQVRRMNFCEWAESDVGWLSGGLWQRACDAGRDLKWADMQGQTAWAGLDLSLSRAFTSLVFAFDSPHSEYDWDIFAMFWMAGDGLLEAERRDHREGLYQAWSSGETEDTRYLRAYPGNKIDHQDVARFLAEADARFDVRGLGYDKAYITVLESEFLRMARPPKFQLVPHPQGFYAPQAPADAPSDASKLYMPLSVKQTEIALRQGKIRVAPNPLLSSHVAAATAKLSQVGHANDPETSDNVYLVTPGPNEYIDGAVSMCMAIGLAQSGICPAESWIFQT